MRSISTFLLDVQLEVLQLRRGVEGLPDAASERMSYYERWAASVAAISMERGNIQQKDLDKHLGVCTNEPDVKCAPAATLACHYNARAQAFVCACPGQVFKG